MLVWQATGSHYDAQTLGADPIYVLRLTVVSLVNRFGDVAVARSR
jgi:hypothetical protein